MRAASCVRVAVSRSILLHSAVCEHHGQISLLPFVTNYSELENGSQALIGITRIQSGLSMNSCAPRQFSVVKYCRDK